MSPLTSGGAPYLHSVQHPPHPPGHRDAPRHHDLHLPHRGHLGGAGVTSSGLGWSHHVVRRINCHLSHLHHVLSRDDLSAGQVPGSVQNVAVTR